MMTSAVALSARDLAAAVRMARSAMPGRGDKTVSITAARGGVAVTGGGPDVRAEAFVASESPGGLAASFDSGLLLGALHGQDGKVWLSPNGSHVTVAGHGREVSIPKASPPGTPDLPAGKPWASGDAGEFRRALARAAKHANADLTRPILCHVLITPDEGGLMVAIDSYRMAMIPAGLAFGKAARDALANAAGLRAVLAGLGAKPAGRVRVRRSATHIAVTHAGRTWHVALMDTEKFPDWRQLIPGECEISVEADRAGLLEAARACAAMPARGAPVRLTASRDRLDLTLAGLAPDLTVRAGVPARTRGGRKGRDLPLEIGLNPEFFADALAAQDGETVTLKLISPLRPAIVGDVLVMPIRLNV